jgi:hypothetical protein
VDALVLIHPASFANSFLNKRPAEKIKKRHLNKWSLEFRATKP